MRSTIESSFTLHVLHSKFKCFDVDRSMLSNFSPLFGSCLNDEFVTFEYFNPLLSDSSFTERRPYHARL